MEHFSTVLRSVVILTFEQIRREWKYFVVANELAYSALRVPYFSKLAKLAKLIE